jgi:hypothetical protein
MKLEVTGPHIMLIASILLLAGCKQKSGFDKLCDQLEGAKAIKSQYVVQIEGQPEITIDLLFSKPNRTIVTSKDFIIATNEVDGHFESLYSKKVYDTYPWSGQPYAGTGKLVGAHLIQGGPVTAMNPRKISPQEPWKLTKKENGIESYTKVIESREGNQVIKMDVDSDGKPIQFTAPGNIVFITKTLEYIPEPPLESFRVKPKDGFVSHRTQVDQIGPHNGSKFDWSKFKASPDVSQFKLKDSNLFAIVDPSEPTSQPVLTWMKKSSSFQKIQVSKGTATTGFFDESGSEIEKLTTTTPFFLLVDKNAQIIGMWIGFDPSKVKEFEADIELASKESN